MGFTSPNSDNTVPFTWAGYHQLPLKFTPRNRHLSGAVHDLFWMRLIFSSLDYKGSPDNPQSWRNLYSSLLKLGDDRSRPCSLKPKSWFSLPKTKIWFVNFLIGWRLPWTLVEYPQAWYFLKASIETTHADSTVTKYSEEFCSNKNRPWPFWFSIFSYWIIPPSNTGTQLFWLSTRPFSSPG